MTYYRIFSVLLTLSLTIFCCTSHQMEFRSILVCCTSTVSAIVIVLLFQMLLKVLTDNCELLYIITGTGVIYQSYLCKSAVCQYAAQQHCVRSSTAHSPYR